MLKNWKSLFVKSDEEESNENSSFESLSFPLNAASSNTAPPSAAPAANYSPKDPALLDVLEVYESGLDSINMPGYDFYEFYKAIESTGHNSEQAYKMAYLMAKTLDKTISPGKSHVLQVKVFDNCTGFTISFIFIFIPENINRVS